MQKPWLLVECTGSIISPGIWDFFLLHHQRVCGPSLRITATQRPWGLRDTELGLDPGKVLEVGGFCQLMLLAWAFWVKNPALS